MSDSKTDFDRAVDYLRDGSLLNDLSNEQKLQLYAFYKQATKGACEEAKPSKLKMVDRKKWEAWNSVSEMSKQEAEKKYIDLVTKLFPGWQEQKVAGVRAKL